MIQGVKKGDRYYNANFSLKLPGFNLSQL